MPNIIKVEPGPPMQGYSASTPTEKAERAFRDKYGYRPKVVVSVPGCVLAGPVREDANLET